MDEDLPEHWSPNNVKWQKDCTGQWSLYDWNKSKGLKTGYPLAGFIVQHGSNFFEASTAVWETGQMEFQGIHQTLSEAKKAVELAALSNNDSDRMLGFSPS